MKVLILLREIAGLVLTPFMLWFSLPKSSDRIVDFFRDYSVHVDGLGYVCTFAMFDFEKAKQQKKKKKIAKTRGTYYHSDDDKMMKSYLYFLESYGENEETTRNGGATTAATTTTAPTITNMAKQQPQSSSLKPKPSPLSQSIYKKLSPKPLTRGRATTAGQGPGDWNSSSYIDPLNHTRNGYLGNLKDRYVPPLPVVDEPLGESFLMTLPKTDVNDYRDDDSREPGVLGMVNQFYKDYQISH
jgi:autophagy-related protein 9